MKIIFLLAAIGLAASIPRPGLQFKNLFKPDVDAQKVLKPRIIGGSNAVPHSRPYQAFLEVQDIQGVRQWYCSGLVLSNNYILTTVTCAGLETFKAFVTLGAHEIFKYNEVGKITVTSHNLTVHPDFNELRTLNNIAVFKLDEPIEFNEYIQPVTLPSKTEAADTFVGETATLSGWGYLGFNPGDWDEPSIFLNVLNSTIVPNSECEEKNYWEIPDSQICISGADGTGGCKGDSGGPLTVEINGVETVIGVFSHTVVACGDGYPNIFTRVTSYLDWIAANTDVVVK